MKIRAINLYNFGSYEGNNTISFENSDSVKRVVIIGGKNGAGKTTLFSALQICLYGHYSFGFKNANRHYFKEIYNLINNKVRLDEAASAYVEVLFEQVTDTDTVLFSVKRLWTWPNGSVQEQLIVEQDGVLLDEERLTNFQNYLVHLIPPELLKLYFFDGEKVADYFLGNNEINVRDALMVLSGNDTFDILYENVKRVLKISDGKHEDGAKDYLLAKQRVDELHTEINAIETVLADLTAQQESAQMAVTQLTQRYADRGGISIEEWSTLQNELKEEEEKRERINWQRKSAATDVLPFLIVKDLVAQIPTQIREEKEYAAYKSVQQLISTPEFSLLLTTIAHDIGSSAPDQDGQRIFDGVKGFFADERWDHFSPLFGLSEDEEAQVNITLGKVNSLESSAFRRYQKRLNTSLERSKIIRAKLQNSDIEHFEEYIQERTRLEEECKHLDIKIAHARERQVQLQDACPGLESKLRSAKKSFEEQLKKQSVSAISGRVLLLLEDLQKELYAKLIQKVEEDINVKFRQLIRKKNFFSYIKIDNNFNIHILRNQDVSKQDLLAQLKGGNLNALSKAIGVYAVEKLQDQLGVYSFEEMKKRITMSRLENYWLPIEIDKNHLSSGEKQIFVMSLYWAMMQQSHNDLPYVIDTPFARIDTEHRANITEHFFKELDGQLIVLSTDEEISGTHMASMQDQIAHVYMLEYGEDKSTHIHENVYFEV